MRIHPGGPADAVRERHFRECCRSNRVPEVQALMGRGRPDSPCDLRKGHHRCRCRVGVWFAEVRDVRAGADERMGRELAERILQEPGDGQTKYAYGYGGQGGCLDAQHEQRKADG